AISKPGIATAVIVTPKIQLNPAIWLNRDSRVRDVPFIPYSSWSGLPLSVFHSKPAVCEHRKTPFVILSLSQGPWRSGAQRAASADQLTSASWRARKTGERVLFNDVYVISSDTAAGINVVPEVGAGHWLKGLRLA